MVGSFTHRASVPPDAAITTGFSFFATVSAILRVGAQPLLVDIDPETFNLDPAAARGMPESRLPGPAVRAILPVHLYGQITDWDRFELLKQEHDVLLIEDAAQAFGASWDGRKAGALGDAAAFSFLPDQKPERRRRRRYGNHHGRGKRSAHPPFARPWDVPRYYHDEVGWNSRLETVQAAVSLAKLGFIDDWNAKRRALAETYRVLFEKRVWLNWGLIRKRE